MDEEYEYDGHVYKLTKLGLSDAKECLSQLQGMGFFDNGLEALISSPKELDQVERKLFRENLFWLNEQENWVPLSKEITENHFAGRLPAYFNLMVKSIGFNFEDFLGGGWATNLNVDPAQE